MGGDDSRSRASGVHIALAEDVDFMESTGSACAAEAELQHFIDNLAISFPEQSEYYRSSNGKQRNRSNI
jgi:hypothetical protein